MRYFIFLMVLIGLLGCAKQYIPIKHEYLPPPEMTEVAVVNGSIDIKNTEKVINNFVKLWEYIEYLLAKGGYK